MTNLIVNLDNLANTVMNEKQRLSISFRCVKVTNENRLKVASLIPRPIIRESNDRIQKLKRSTNMDTSAAEEYPIIAKISNISGLDVNDISISGSVVLKLNSSTEPVKFEVKVDELKAKDMFEVILFDASGIVSSIVNIESVKHRLPKEQTTISDIVPEPYFVDVNELRSPLGGFRDQAELETYYLLNTYTQEGRHIRGSMLRKLFELLAQVNTGKYKVGSKEFVIPYAELAKMRSIIQIEIVSKIMMYIEDLVILLLSNKESNRNYYDFLDKSEPNEGDVGDVIRQFLNDIDAMSREELREMLCYVDPASMSLENREKAILSKLIYTNVREVRSLLKWVKVFRHTHVQIFRRYKHAGIPIRLGVEVNLIGSDNPYAKGGFDSFAMVITGKNDPLKEVRLLPYSQKVIDAYEILIASLEFFIPDFVANKIASIKRRTDRLVPFEMYADPGSFSSEEIQIIKKIADQYYYERPVRAQNQFLELNTQETKEIAKWYIELDSFLAEAESKKMLQDRYGSIL